MSEPEKDQGGGGDEEVGPPGGGGEGSQSGPSYSDKLKMNVKKAERFKRNVLEITLENDPGVKASIDHDTTSKLLSKLGIEKSDCTGVQPCPGFSRKICVWLKEGVNIEQFCKNESFMVANGVKTGMIRPMGRREVSVLIKGLNFNTPDSLVREYLGKHGNDDEAPFTPTSKFAKCLAKDVKWTQSCQKSQRKRDLSVSPSDSLNLRNVKPKGASKNDQQAKSVKSIKVIKSRLPQFNSTKC